MNRSTRRLSRCSPVEAVIGESRRFRREGSQACGVRTDGVLAVTLTPDTPEWAVIDAGGSPYGTWR